MGDVRPQSRKSRWARGCLIALAVVLGILALAVIIFALWYRSFSAHARAELDQITAEIRAAGDPLTPEEVAPPPIPDEENAAPILEEAFGLLDEDAGSKPEDWDIYIRSGHCDWTSTAEERVRMYRGFLEPNERALAKVREALKRPKCRFDLDYSRGFRMELPHLGQMRHLARLFDMSAYREFDAGRTDGAMSEAVNIIDLENCLRDEPVHLSQLVRIAMIGIALPRIAFIVASRRGSAEALTHVSKSLETGIVDREALVKSAKAISVRGDSLAQDCSLSDGLFLQGVFDKNKVLYHRYLARYLQAWNKPYWQSAPEVEKIDSEVRAGCSSMWYFTSASHYMAGFLVDRTFHQMARCEAWTTVVRLGCLVELYRLRKGTLPAKLEDLVPEFASALPLDPFTGKGYVYCLKPDGQGYVIYSVGENQKDDGGVWDAQGRGVQNWPDGDIVFECPAAPAASAAEEPGEGR